MGGPSWKNQAGNISSNAISGPLPDRFASVPSLVSLYLDNNQFTGPLPASLLSSSSLSFLHLSNNSLSGSLAFPSAANLTSLYAARNQFSSLDLSGNGGLEKVVLDFNTISGPLPDLSTMPNLQIFSVSRNGFFGEVKGLEGVPNLYKLPQHPHAPHGHDPNPELLQLHLPILDRPSDPLALQSRSPRLFLLSLCHGASDSGEFSSRLWSCL
ncbi:hypothetical protein MNV49_000744 [Pseudohyphozyma bogoriensis]|nr:hypothetical protein MNV49_000744 [Pseudohyphozyma bogoriensis]